MLLIKTCSIEKRYCKTEIHACVWRAPVIRAKEQKPFRSGEFSSKLLSCCGNSYGSISAGNLLSNHSSSQSSGQLKSVKNTGFIAVALINNHILFLLLVERKEKFSTSMTSLYLVVHLRPINGTCELHTVQCAAVFEKDMARVNKIRYLLFRLSNHFNG